MPTLPPLLLAFITGREGLPSTYTCHIVLAAHGWFFSLHILTSSSAFLCRLHFTAGLWFFSLSQWDYLFVRFTHTCTACSHYYETTSPPHIPQFSLSVFLLSYIIQSLPSMCDSHVWLTTCSACDWRFNVFFYYFISHYLV